MALKNPMRTAEEFDVSELEAALEYAMRHFSEADKRDVRKRPELNPQDSTVVARARAIQRRILDERGFH